MRGMWIRVLGLVVLACVCVNSVTSSTQHTRQSERRNNCPLNCTNGQYCACVGQCCQCVGPVCPTVCGNTCGEEVCGCEVFMPCSCGTTPLPTKRTYTRKARTPTKAVRTPSKKPKTPTKKPRTPTRKRATSTKLSPTQTKKPDHGVCNMLCVLGSHCVCAGGCCKCVKNTDCVAGCGFVCGERRCGCQLAVPCTC